MMGRSKCMAIKGGFYMRPPTHPEPPAKDPKRMEMRRYWETLSQETLLATTSFILLALLLALALSLLFV